MTAIELLGLIVRWAYVLVAAATLWNFLRDRNRARLDIALVFVALAAGILGAELQTVLALPGRWLTIISGMAVLAQPYLVLRLVAHFRPLPRLVNWLGLAGLLASWVVVIFLTTSSTPATPPSPLSLIGTLIVIVYFGGAEIYATVAFVLGAIRSAGVLRRRLVFAAAGSGWLAAPILLSGLFLIYKPAAVLAPLSPVFTLLSAISYYIAFSPPAALRKAWQLSELYRFLRAAAGRPSAERVRGTLDYLCPAATRAVGSQGSAVFLWDDLFETFTLRASDQPALRASDQPALTAAAPLPGAGPLERTWRERRALHLGTLAGAGLELTGLAAGVGATAIDLLPLASPERVWGVLASFRLRPSLFPDDDLAVLQLFAEQTAEALETGELFERQQELVEQLEAANKELEAFSYSVSHDLRSPIRAMTGFSQMIAEDEDTKLSDESQRWLARVQANATRMGRLVDDLLSFSRSGRQPLNLRPVDFKEQVRMVWDDLRANPDGRTVELEMGDLPPCLADPALLRQVLTNLLSNALKFTRQQPAARIIVGCRQADPDPVYYIQDNGVGFDMTYANKLFGVFQRLHNVEDFEGTGIGLAIVQRIILRHGGTIAAESQLGQGATFTLTLKGVVTNA